MRARFAALPTAALATLVLVAPAARAQTTVWSQTAEITVKDAVSQEFGYFFGATTALEGDTLFVGAPEEGMVYGKVYVFGRTGTGWSQQQMLPDTGGAFGTAIALSGALAVVGAPHDALDINAVPVGAAHAYALSGGTWLGQGLLTPSERAASDAFGASVALSGSSAVVGAPSSHAAKGAAFVFTQAAGSWAQEAELTAGDGAFDDGFGAAVAMSGATILVVAPFKSVAATTMGTAQGVAYVFTKSGAAWTQQAELPLPGEPMAQTGYRTSAVLTDGSAFVGIASVVTGGRVHVFAGSGSTWTLAQTLQATVNEGPTNFFGTSIALSGNTLLVGSWGYAYFFTSSGTTWSLAEVVQATDSLGLDPNVASERSSFGSGVSLSGTTAFVGAPQQQVGRALSQGIAYGFSLEETDAAPCGALAPCLPPPADGGVPPGEAAPGPSAGGTAAGSPAGGCACAAVPGESTGGGAALLAWLALLALGSRVRGRPCSPGEPASCRESASPGASGGAH
jgi:hypothetical protein